MKNAFVPVLQSSDLKHLPALAEHLRQHRPKRLYILANPNIGIESSGVVAKMNAELVTLNQFKMDAANRNDTQAFANYVTQIEAKAVERDLAERDSWRTVTPDALATSIEAALKPLLDPALAENIKYESLREVAAKAEFYAVLHKMRGAWPNAVIPHGSYVLLWPEAFPDSMSAAVSEQLRKGMQKMIASEHSPRLKVPVSVDKKTTDPEVRRAQLRASRFMGVKSAAKQLGVSIEGKEMEAIITDIIAKEAESVQPASA